jgi:hypothetical protein
VPERLAVTEMPRSLLAAPEAQRPWYSIVLWWELRRVPYNLVLGLTGFLGIVLFLLIDALPPRPPSGQTDFEYLFALMGGAVAANICYTGGWLVELMLQLPWPRRVHQFGPTAFRVGLLFSVGVALAPAAINAFTWAHRSIGVAVLS